MKYFDKNKCIEDLCYFLQSSDSEKLNITNIINNNIKIDSCYIGAMKNPESFIRIRSNEGMEAGIIDGKPFYRPKPESAEKYKNADGFYDLPVGTKFIYKGKKCQVVAQMGCNAIYECSFLKNCICSKILCVTFSRKDKTTVIFKKIK